MNSRQRRAGFTLIFVIVITAIIAVLFAAAGTELTTLRDVTDAQTTYSILANIDSGICGEAVSGGACQNTSFDHLLNVYPGRPSHLAKKIVALNISYQNSCWTGAAQEYTAAETTSWNTGSIYTRYYVNGATSSTGLWTPFGYIWDTIIRTNAATNKNESLKVFIPGVSGRRAQMLDNLVDGSDGNASGRIQWNATVNDTTTVFYFIPVNKGC